MDLEELKKLAQDASEKKIAMGAARIARTKRVVELYSKTDFDAMGLKTVGKQADWVKNATADLRLKAYEAEAAYELSEKIFDIEFRNWFMLNE